MSSSTKPIDEVAREHAERAVQILADVMEFAAEDRDRIRAAESILDRGYGKASQAIIQVPASKQQAAILAGMTDAQLVAIIEAKQLPRLGGPQTIVDVPNATTKPVNTNSAPPPNTNHGPAEEIYADETDELLL